MTNDRGIAHESVILDLIVKRFPAASVNRTQDFPLDVIRQTGQDLLVVGSSETVHAVFDGLLGFRRLYLPVCDSAIE